jgi:hypothetical protein
MCSFTHLENFSLDLHSLPSIYSSCQICTNNLTFFSSRLKERFSLFLLCHIQPFLKNPSYQMCPSTHSGNFSLDLHSLPSLYSSCKICTNNLTFFSSRLKECFSLFLLCHIQPFPLLINFTYKPQLFKISLSFSFQFICSFHHD